MPGSRFNLAIESVRTEETGKPVERQLPCPSFCSIHSGKEGLVESLYSCAGQSGNGCQTHIGSDYLVSS